MTRHKKRTAVAVLFLENWLLLIFFLPSGKQHSPVQLIEVNRFLLGEFVFSIKNISIKWCEAKQSGKKDFIFYQIAVNQLFL
jgi:hypothetical protein